MQRIDHHSNDVIIHWEVSETCTVPSGDKEYEYQIHSQHCSGVCDFTSKPWWGHWNLDHILRAAT